MSILIVRDNCEDDTKVWVIGDRNGLDELTGRTVHVTIENNVNVYELDSNGMVYRSGEIYDLISEIFNKTLPHTHLQFPFQTKRDTIIDMVSFTY